MKISSSKFLLPIIFAFLALTLLLVLIIPSSSNSNRTVQVNLSSASKQALHVLPNLFASNGQTGFFVEPSASVGSAISLYQTSWWLLADPSISGVDSAAVEQWAGPLLYSTDPATAENQGVSPLQEIFLSSLLYQHFGWRVNENRFSRTLSGLQQGLGYRSGAPGAKPSLFDTETAMVVAHNLGVEIPVAIQASALAKLRSLVGQQTTASEQVLVLLLLSLDRKQVVTNSTVVRSALHKLSSQLLMGGNLERVAILAQLTNVAATAKDPNWFAGASCQGAKSLKSGASLSQTSALDPQLTFDEVLLKCITTVSPPPWTSSGWPNLQAISGAIGATVDGITIAKESHSEGQYESLVKRQLTENWLPQVGKSGVNAMTNLAASIELADLMNLKVTLPSAFRGDVLRNMASPTSSSFIVLAGALFSRDKFSLSKSQTLNDVNSIAKLIQASRGGLPYTVLAQLEYLLTGINSFHLQGITSLKLMGILNDKSKLPSNRIPLIYDVAASWVLNSSLNLSQIVNLAICKQNLTCFEGTGYSSGPGNELINLGMIIRLNSGSFPIAL